MHPNLAIPWRATCTLWSKPAVTWPVISWHRIPKLLARDSGWSKSSPEKSCYGQPLETVDHKNRSVEVDKYNLSTTVYTITRIQFYKRFKNYAFSNLINPVQSIHNIWIYRLSRSRICSDSTIRAINVILLHGTNYLHIQWTCLKGIIQPRTSKISSFNNNCDLKNSSHIRNLEV